MNLATTLTIQGTVSGITGVLIGSGLEFYAKDQAGPRNQTVRSVLEVFGKVIQSASAAYALIILGSLSTTPLIPGMAIGVGTVMVLTPLLNKAAQLTRKQGLKEFMETADNVVSISSKLMNTAALTAATFQLAGLFQAANIGGTCLALSFATYMKE